MIETIISSGINLIGIVICYVLGYRKATKDTKPGLETKTETRDCICGHKVTYHAHSKEKIGGCVAIVKFIREKSFRCACQKYIPDPKSEMIWDI